MPRLDDIPELKAWRLNQSRLTVALLGPAQDAAVLIQGPGRYRLLSVPNINAALSLVHAPDVLLYPMDKGEDGLLVLHQHLSRKKTTFLVAGSTRFASPEICRIARVSIDWPVKSAELSTALKQIQADAPVRGPRLSRENVRRLALLWSRKETGLIRYRGIPGVADGELKLHAGGVSPGGWSMLYQLLHGGTLRFKRSRSLTLADADRDWLGRLLLSAAWKRGTSAFALQCGGGRLRAGQPAADLSLSTETHCLLAAADGVTTVAALLNRLGIHGAAVGEDLYTLQALRLLEWKTRPGCLNSTRSETSQVTSKASQSSHSQTVSGVTRLGSRRIARPEQVRCGLRKIRSGLERASAESILGVTAGVSPEMLQIAEDRLVKRYDDILSSVNVPDDIAELARELRQITRRAARTIRQQGSGISAPSDAVGHDYRSGQRQTREDELLVRGHRLIEAQDWAQADHLLSDALRLSAIHPGVLSALAWARYHHAGLNKPDREGQARQLLRRALEQDAGFAEAHYYLASIHHVAGNAIAARAAARRAARLDPSDARYAKLLAKV
ncbi:MAG: hypothetical protein ACI8RZ_000830 [Myxococcota bacterium]|jgi:hypothetical protein